MENPFLHYVDDFEKEAEAFLEKYACADAIENPRRIPILDIATRLMSLDVIQTESLSPDESVQGAIAFSKGVIDVYDWKTKEYMGFRVESPSIFVDSDIINVGRVNNTLAHECYHWWRHRNYFNFKRVHEQSTEFGIRCDKHMRKNVEKGRWTDVERMEWQARTIAPKILMPRTATKKKVDSLYRELTQGTGLAKDAVTETLIAKLADFFEVSKQSAAIRIQNVYYMLSYAFQVLNEQGYKNIATEQFQNTAELMAAILEKGIALQLKRGLGKEYIPQMEALSSLRGKIDIAESIKTQSMLRKQLICTYDEFSVNSTMNRIIKSTVELLLCSNISKQRKKNLRKLMVYFGEVDFIDLHTVNWNVQYNRNNQTYRMLISICYLVVKGLLQTQSDGSKKVDGLSG